MNAKEIFEIYSEWFGGDFSYAHNPVTGGYYTWHVRIGVNTIMKIMSGGEYSTRIYSDKENSSFDILVVNIIKSEDRQYHQEMIQCSHVCVPYYLVLEFIHTYRNN